MKSSVTQLSWLRLILLLWIAAAIGGCNRSSKPNGQADREAPNSEKASSLPPTETPGTKPSGANPSGTEGSDGENSAGDASDPSARAPASLHGAVYDRQALVDEANRLAGQQDPASAAALLRWVLVVDPEDVEVMFLLANLEASTGELASAVDLLDEIPSDHPDAGLPALGQSADWCFQLKRYRDAERRYLRVIERAPHAYRARRQLAYLLNRQGRRHEAAVQIRELCKLGNVRQDELHSLIMLSSAMYDDPSDDSKTLRGDRPYWPIGLSGEARHLFNEEKFREAADLLQPVVTSGMAPAAVVAFYGRAVLESQDDERFQEWLSLVDDETQQHAEYWAAIGAYELSQLRFPQATRALAEAISRDPTDLTSIRRLRQALDTLGEKKLSAQWRDHWHAVLESVRFNNQIAATTKPDPEVIVQLVGTLRGLNRPLEAVLWTTIEGNLRGMPSQMLQKLNGDLQQLVAADRGFPSPEIRLYGMDLQKYPLPELESVASARRPWRAPNETPLAPASPAVFENIAASVGLDHTYRVSTEDIKDGFAMYQAVGGGVVVLDYDLDGTCDLYFAQGQADPPSYRGDASNQLLRQTDDSLTNVASESGSVETQYTTGVTSGDWNQDGFPDLVLANIGVHVLLINNGDGTFTRQPLSDTPNLQRVPSSVAMGDISGDALPDIVIACYVEDPDIATKPARDDAGRVLEPMSPGDFDLGSDQLLINDGEGGSIGRPLNRQSGDRMPGLGVIVADFDGESGNEVFVGNDAYPNQLWRFDAETAEWSDVAPLTGCAYSFAGVATASMGIAAADFDQNGAMDLLVTNYEDENVCLFLNEQGAFHDRNVQFGLDGPTRSLLGFGTQAIDYDNDGLRDLVITNGHVDDSLQDSSPFQQPCQLFRNVKGRFELVLPQDRSGYLVSDHVGRALARLDFNADGKTDFVVTHIGQPSALLINQTPSQHHWLQIRLIGTKSERDGIGARVRVRTKEREAFDWRVAGDGYLSRNEPILSFGLGEASEAEVVVDWPSGESQVIESVAADQRIIVIERQ